jgi:hypothetical protein
MYDCGVAAAAAAAGTSRAMQVTTGRSQHTATHWSLRHSECGTMQVGGSCTAAVQLLVEHKGVAELL